jgi:hypothetical protein
MADDLPHFAARRTRSFFPPEVRCRPKCAGYTVSLLASAEAKAFRDAIIAER